MNLPGKKTTALPVGGSFLTAGYMERIGLAAVDTEPLRLSREQPGELGGSNWASADHDLRWWWWRQPRVADQGEFSTYVAAKNLGISRQVVDRVAKENLPDQAKLLRQRGECMTSKEWLIKAYDVSSEHARSAACKMVMNSDSGLSALDIVELGTLVGRVGAGGSSFFFATRQLQNKFDHAPDFGVNQTWNKQAASAFQAAMTTHIQDPSTVMLQAKYRGRPGYTFFFNPNTSNVVFFDPTGQFESGWTLSPEQVENLLKRGNLQ